MDSRPFRLEKCFPLSIPNQSIFYQWFYSFYGVDCLIFISCFLWMQLSVDREAHPLLSGYFLIQNGPFFSSKTQYKTVPWSHLYKSSVKVPAEQFSNSLLYCYMTKNKFKFNKLYKFIFIPVPVISLFSHCPPPNPHWERMLGKQLSFPDNPPGSGEAGCFLWPRRPTGSTSCFEPFTDLISWCWKRREVAWSTDQWIRVRAGLTWWLLQDKTKRITMAASVHSICRG